MSAAALTWQIYCAAPGASGWGALWRLRRNAPPLSVLPAAMHVRGRRGAPSALDGQDDL